MESDRALPSEKGASTRYAAEEQKEAATGIEFVRHFTREGVSPYDEIEWETRTATISNEKGDVLFQQENVEIPKAWSQTATNIVVSKYFHGHGGHAAAGEQRAAAGRPRGAHDDGVGRQGRVLRFRSAMRAYSVTSLPTCC